MLVVYYTRTGHTEHVANELSKLLGADIETIEEEKDREGWLGFLRSGYEAWRGKEAPILPDHLELEKYDLVIIGTPVWAGHIASPTRSFINKHARECKAFAFFCTMGGNDPGAALDDLKDLCGGHTPIAMLSISARELRGDRYSRRLK
jgi:flavodoxin